MASIGYERISKKNFYRWGGFSNSKLFRRMRSGAWHYFWNHNLS